MKCKGNLRCIHVPFVYMIIQFTHQFDQFPKRLLAFRIPRQKIQRKQIDTRCVRVSMKPGQILFLKKRNRIINNLAHHIVRVGGAVIHNPIPLWEFVRRYLQKLLIIFPFHTDIQIIIPRDHPSVADGPWPMFPSDLVSILIVLATQTRGTCLFFEKMFESRLYFVDHLIGMGAKIVQCDPHRVVVTGPTQLVGSTVTSPDIRAGIALILAALCAKGKTTILNAESVDRGYESVEKELGALGGDVRRL